MRTTLLLLISAYRKWISPILPGVCRFHPTCSTYARTAVENHGSLRGGWLVIRRLARCHPLHPGGLDPVPPPGGRGAAQPRPVARIPGSPPGDLGPTPVTESTPYSTDL